METGYITRKEFEAWRSSVLSYLDGELASVRRAQDSRISALLEEMHQPQPELQDRIVSLPDGGRALIDTPHTRQDVDATFARMAAQLDWLMNALTLFARHMGLELPEFREP
jgi:hypothetical protein